MPIWLRNLTFTKIKNHYEKTQNLNSGGDVVTQNRKTLQSAGATSDSQKISVPQYVVKASKK